MILTCFGKIELLFKQVRHEPKKGDESTQGCADDVEIIHREGRHFEPCSLDQFRSLDS